MVEHCQKQKKRRERERSAFGSRLMEKITLGSLILAGGGDQCIKKGRGALVCASSLTRWLTAELPDYQQDHRTEQMPIIFLFLLPPVPISPPFARAFGINATSTLVTSVKCEPEDVRSCPGGEGLTESKNKSKNSWRVSGEG